MKKVLVVDDTAVVRSFLTRAFKPHASKFEVLTAENGKEAVDMIQNFKVDLVITDVEMPVISPMLKCLSWMGLRCLRM